MLFKKDFVFLRPMSELTINIYTKESHLPTSLREENFFHSTTYFRLAKRTPRLKPYMVTIETSDGMIAAQMLALVRYRSSLFPPYLYRHCMIMGEGEYHALFQEQRATLFGMMMERLTAKIGRWTLYLEVSHLSSKMFAYKQLRELHYFPVRWNSVHNSLHSRTPEERISKQLQHRIDTAYDRGVVTDEVKTEEDFKSFIKLLRQHNRLKLKRYIPAEEFFRGINESTNGRLYVTRYHGHIIGCAAVVYSQQQAYLWYAAYRRKTYAFVHPSELTIWHAIKDSHARGYEHIFFLDVGLPYQKNAFRDFILRFGGKPTSSYRWFHCTIGWINSVLSWFYRD